MEEKSQVVETKEEPKDGTSTTSEVETTTAEEKVDETEEKSDVDIAAAIEQAKKDAIAEYVAKQEEEARKAKLTPEERKAEEDSAKDKQIADLQHELMVRNCKDKAVQALDEKKLPVGLADILNYESEESAQTSLDAIVKVFGECLENAVKERLKGRTPTGLNANNDINSFADEQAKIYKQMGIKQ